jgi:predicted metalloprotease
VAVIVLVLVIGSGRGFHYDDPLERMPAGGTAAGNVRDAAAGQRSLTQFLEFVVGDVQRFWAQQFRRSDLEYTPARLVLFHSGVSTACGAASAATGPFYCALDRSVYLDVGFFRVLAERFGAPGDFAQAYVIAHELGHHVQNLTGIMAQMQEAVQEEAGPPNVLSIRLELQADCLAGVWGHSTSERKLLEPGDLDEGLRAAAAVGDDRIQARITGRVDPESWTHGSSQQRRSWFLRGFTDGKPGACDTFSSAL